jgi:hypothetical protein
MQEVLIDGGQFVPENEIERLDDFEVALKRGFRGRPWRCLYAASLS